MMGNLHDALKKEGISATTGREKKPAGWLNTGNYALNWAVGGRFSRGYPLGHSTEFFGEPGTGKSYLILRAIAEAQAANGTTILDDTEHAFNPDWADRQLGVDIDNLVVHNSDTVERHYDLLVTLLEYLEDNPEDAQEGAPYVFALDSLGELTTQHELDVGLSKPSMEKAKKLHALMRLVGHRLSSLPAAYFVANHIYSGAGWGGPKSHGGRALEYKASTRIQLKSVKKIQGKSKNDITGVFINAYVAKNRAAPPFRSVEMAIPFHEPISKYSGLIPVLLDIGVVEESGRTLAYKGEDTKIYTQKTNPLKQIRSAEELLAEHPEILDEADRMLAEKEVGGESIYDDELVEDEDD